jgi:hypothetical protein
MYAGRRATPAPGTRQNAVVLNICPFGGELIEKGKKSSRREMSGADPGGSAPTSVNRNESHREGVSSTKVSRGDRIRTCDIQLPKLAL